MRINPELGFEHVGDFGSQELAFVQTDVDRLPGIDLQ